MAQVNILYGVVKDSVETATDREKEKALILLLEACSPALIIQAIKDAKLSPEVRQIRNGL